MSKASWIRYQDEKGVAIDLESAADYDKKSADQGNAYAQLNYGLCLELGRGAASDRS
jgi:TPR repeat protein